MSPNIIFSVGFIGGMFFSIGALFLMIRDRHTRRAGIFCMMMSVISVGALALSQS